MVNIPDYEPVHHQITGENPMSNVYAFFAPRAVRAAKWSTPSLLDTALTFLNDYEPVQGWTVSQSGEDAAEEVFDLTNNSSREVEREDLQWDRQSISVGDIVQVDETFYLCEGVGWTKLPDGMRPPY
jgi:hypothetical protein